MPTFDEPHLPAASSLRQVVGALVFGSERELSVEAIRKCLQEVATESEAGEAGLFAGVSPRDIRDALLDVQKDLERLGIGFELREVGGGFRFQTQPGCGRWVRSLLKKDRPSRLSRPALETLAIIAYRQPIARSEIEGIRGVAVDHIVKALMEMHLVRIVGRSDLPGRPFLYGTTATFMEHFGLKSLDELNEMDPTLQRSKPRDRAAAHRRPKAKGEGETGGDPAPPDGESAPETSPMDELLTPAAPPDGAEPVIEPPAGKHEEQPADDDEA